MTLENKQDSLANVWGNVAEALQGLGYSQSEISEAYHKLRSSSAGQEKSGEEELIKEMLLLLSAVRGGFGLEENNIQQYIAEEEKELEFSLRPTSFADFIGQKNLKQKLTIYIKAAKEETNP